MSDVVNTAEILPQMTQVAIDMLEAIDHKPFKQRAKEIAKTLLGRDRASDRDPLFWPAGFLLLGLTAIAEFSRTGIAAEIGDRCLQAAKMYLDRWSSRGQQVSYTDDALAGCAMIACYRLAGEEAYLTMADAVYAYLMKAPTDAEGSVIYHPSGGNRCIYADGTGMVVLFLSEYALVRDRARESAFRLAKLQLANYRKYGMDEATGLPYHGYELCADGSAERKGLVGWGRATGFLLMGLAGYGKATTDPEIASFTKDLFSTVLKYRRRDGCFPWHLQSTNAHVDTSATAMIGWALAGSREWLSELSSVDEGKTGIRDIAAGLTAYVKDGTMTESLAECVDFGEHPQRYGVYPWGQGAALAFLSQFHRKG